MIEDYGISESVLAVLKVAAKNFITGSTHSKKQVVLDPILIYETPNNLGAYTSAIR